MTFDAGMRRARVLQAAEGEPERQEYWAGYVRGLRRAHHGEAFGTEEEHALWLRLAKDRDPMRRARGEGYRDGLAAISAIGRAIGSIRTERKARSSRENGKLGGRPLEGDFASRSAVSRIERGLEAAGIRKAEFCRRIGVSSAYLSRVLLGRQRVTDERLRSLIEAAEHAGDQGS